MFLITLQVGGNLRAEKRKDPKPSPMNANNRVYFLAINYKHFGKIGPKQDFPLWADGTTAICGPELACILSPVVSGEILSWVSLSLKNTRRSQHSQHAHKGVGKQTHKHTQE